MWNYQSPFVPQYFPFYNPEWPQFPLLSFPMPSQVSRPLSHKVSETTSFPEIQSPGLSLLKQKAQRSEQEPSTPKKSVKSKPIRRKTREDSFDKKRQKKDRNVPSNICRFFITFLFQNTQPLRSLGISNQNHEETLKKCIEQVKEHIQENQNYIRPCIIERMCQGEMLGVEESAIFRAMFYRFIRVELKMIVSMIRKLRKKEKLVYFKISGRFLKKFLARK